MPKSGLKNPTMTHLTARFNKKLMPKERKLLGKAYAEDARTMAAARMKKTYADRVYFSNMRKLGIGARKY